MSERKNKRKNNSERNNDCYDFSKKNKTSEMSFYEFTEILEDIEIEDTFFQICSKCNKEYIGFYSIPKTYTVCWLCK
jgi:hypothetical protein